MPQCPNCKAWHNRRVAGCCPTCGSHVYLYTQGKGKRATKIWVLDDPSCSQLVDALRDHIRRQQGVPDFEFANRLPELGIAKTLLDKCGGDMQLALLVIEMYFSGRREIWVKPQSMAQVIWSTPVSPGSASGCFNLALALARSIRRAEQAKTPKEIEAMELF